ncbi:MAG: hypothetical protein QY309_11535 [Cyclobacteriaceae bacterium]|nr:MAG: hypothetical protein QY309_11535 [Cyclobacteriaceae bacterium]
MNDFTTWWEGLNLSLKIYWALAIPFTLFFLLQLVLSFMGGDVPDDTPDAEVEADTGIAFQFFTLKNLVAFFSIFGWTGIACIDSGLSETTSLIIALVAGLIMMTVMASIFYFLGKANADGTLKMKNALGGVGEVYMTIKSKRGGIGKVQIKIQNSLRTLDAMTDDDQDIPTGKIITVKQVLNDSILVVTAK